VTSSFLFSSRRTPHVPEGSDSTVEQPSIPLTAERNAMQAGQAAGSAREPDTKRYDGNGEAACSSDSDTKVGSPTTNRRMSRRFSQSNQKMFKVEREAEVVKQRMVTELDGVDEKYFTSFTLEKYISSIADERLIHLPHRGSSWDRVLMEAEFFGLQLASFADVVHHFVPGALAASNTALASCHFLIEVNPR
jgi:hypothetical protein